MFAHRLASMLKNRNLWWVGAALAVCLLIAPSASALCDDDDELLAARKRLEALLKQAQEHERVGQTVKARELMRRAEELKARIGQSREGRGRARPGDDDLREILGGLEHGMNALRALRRMDDLERLERIANDLRGEMRARERHRGADRERQALAEQIEVLRMAVRALAAADRDDAADLMERALHARELALEGRRDDEAMEIRRGAPKRGAMIELLRLAQGILRERGQEERAFVIGKLADQFARRHEEGRERRGAERERQVAREQLKVMRMGLHALLEAERRDAAELMEHAIHARELALDGRRGDEAMEIRESAPGREDQIELLLLAREILQDYGQEERASAVGKLAREFSRKRRPASMTGERLHREGREPGERLEAARERIGALNERLADLRELMVQMQEEIQELRRMMRMMMRD